MNRQYSGGDNRRKTRRQADKMINEITLAIVAKMGLRKISNIIHPYPTQAAAIQQVADAYNRTRLDAVS